jgi:hypothetical protein
MAIDGHEAAVVSTLGGAFLVAHRTLPAGWMKTFVHRQPVAAMACAWAFVGFSLPLIVPKVRRAMKMPTNHYDAEHPNVVMPKY